MLFHEIANIFFWVILLILIFSPLWIIIYVISKSSTISQVNDYLSIVPEKDANSDEIKG